MASWTKKQMHNLLMDWANSELSIEWKSSTGYPKGSPFSRDYSDSGRARSKEPRVFRRSEIRTVHLIIKESPREVRDAITVKYMGPREKKKQAMVFSLATGSPVREFENMVEKAQKYLIEEWARYANRSQI